VTRAPATWLVAGALLFSVRNHTDAQTVVESTFLPRFGEYSNPANWSPAEVPNNTDTRVYNVTLGAPSGVEVDLDARISNLRVAARDDAFVSVEGRAFVVTGETSIGRLRTSIRSGAAEPGLFDAGALASFSGGALTGDYDISGFGAADATLQFRGADVRTLRNARLSLAGPSSRVLDENGSDALARLSEIDAASRFELESRNWTSTTRLAVGGSIELRSYSGQPTIFTAAGGLANYDPATRTLQGGRFAADALTSGSPAELRIPGADILSNGSSISLRAAAARMTDESGLDALRNLRRNLPGSELELRNRTDVVTGDFTNDGKLTVSFGKVRIVGELTNFDRATRTLRGGAYDLLGDLRYAGEVQFPGADIVRNGAFISGPGKIVDELGNDALRNVAENLETGGLVIEFNRDFVTAGSFTNAGTVGTLGGGAGAPDPPRDGTFSLPPGATYTQTSGRTTNNGALRAAAVDIRGGVLEGSGAISGNVAVGNAIVRPGGVISGSLTLSPESRVHCTIGEFSMVSAWRNIPGTVTLAGTLSVEIEYDNYLASNAVLTIIRSSQPLVGAFSNAPHGTRITTVDGSASFVVNYSTNAVTLTGFQQAVQPARLVNISGRGRVGVAADPFVERRSLVGGFIITGAESKTVVVRGIGPTLARHGVPNALSDPTIELHRSRPGIVATNDNWRDTQAAVIAATGLAPDHPAEAAIHATLAPGEYTVVLQDKNGVAGNALVEVYEVSGGSAAKLGNISTRAYVEPASPLIGGIITRGGATADLVIRAIGPSLRRFGVFTAMADPTLEVRDSNGALLAFNDNYSYQGLGAARHTFSPSSPEESAVLLSVSPGNYTAIVRDRGNSGGTALVEVFDLRR
jgi:hypothetical protein